MIVDTSIWLEILFSQPLKERCLKEIQGKSVHIPSLCFYECLKKLRSKLSDTESMEAISSLSHYTPVDMTPEIALFAADLSIEHGLGMADSIVLAHAHALDVPLLTLDNDFAKIPGVKILRT